MKQAVQQFWDAEPCGTRGNVHPAGTLAYFESISQERNRLEPFIVDYAQFEKWSGKDVLEVGCGAGSDLIRFAQNGANITGIDLSHESVKLARARLKLYGYKGKVFVADGEKLSLFRNDRFDLVYSWGVLHHTPDTSQAISEIHRVTKHGGEICIMLYHRHSLVALQVYFRFGLLAFESLKSALANHLESPGTKAYTVTEAKRMFSMFEDLRINVQFTPYDFRWGRNRYLPRWISRFVPISIGWFLIIQGRKA
jgi:ubiquinone/menaquinone biosynthesis C-methylase UbiE